MSWFKTTKHHEDAITEQEVSRLRKKVGQLEAGIANRDKYLDYMHSRIHAIEHHGWDTGNGEVRYNIQSRKGCLGFSAMYLPKVGAKK